MLQCRQHTEWNADQQLHEQGVGGEEGRWFDAFEQRLGDRNPKEDRLPEIPPQHVAKPLDELHRERLVQPQLVPQRFHLFRSGLVAQDHGGGVTRCEVDQGKHDQTDDENDWDQQHQPSKNVGNHLVSSTTVRCRGGESHHPGRPTSGSRYCSSQIFQ